MYKHFVPKINWAWGNDADVINCSWFAAIELQIIADAIQNALQKGRGSNGCVVVFAAANDNYPSTYYPANSDPDILVVGAIDHNGKRVSKWQTDDLYHWGSNYGALLDVMAPGIDIPTTDIRGSGSYGGNYDLSFGGTSAAAPHVAGIAALILSVNPNLTQKQVVDIIESTARKVSVGLPDPGPEFTSSTGHIYNYQTTPGRPNGTWDFRMGYGLVDAYAAVANASLTTLLPQTITGPDESMAGTEETYTFTPSVMPSGVTFAGWTVTGGAYTAPGGLNNPALNITFTNSAQYTLTANFALPGGGSPYSISKVVRAAYYLDNQIFYSSTTLIYSDGMFAENITVKSGATLTLQAPSITINQPFVVEAGAGLVLTR